MSKRLKILLEMCVSEYEFSEYDLFFSFFLLFHSFTESRVGQRKLEGDYFLPGCR